MQELTTALDELKNLVLLREAVIVILVLINLGAVLKRWHRLPDALIPLLLAILGAVGYAWLAKVANHDYRAGMLPLNIGLGALFGFSTVGIHQFIRQTPFLRNLPLVSLLVPPSGDTVIVKKEDV
jgi:hypothetical protein